MKLAVTITFCLLSIISFAQIPTDGLLVHYPFAGGAVDQSENSYDGVVNGAELTEDRFSLEGNAYDFDGMADYIVVPNEDELKPDFPLTLSLWFKIDAFGETSSVMYASDEESLQYAGFWIGYIPNGSISAGYGDGLGLGGSHRVTKSSNTIIETGDWHHVIAVFNGLNDIDLYIDCVLDPGSYSGTANSMDPGSHTGSIGRSAGHSGSSHHNGQIDDIRLYDYAMDEEEVNALCHEGPFVVSVKEIDSSEFTLYPNPASDYVQIDMGSSNYKDLSINILDVSGRLMYSEKAQAPLVSIYVADWDRTGIYFVQILDSQQKVIGNRKLVLR